VPHAAVLLSGRYVLHYTVPHAAVLLSGGCVLHYTVPHTAVLYFLIASNFFRSSNLIGLCVLPYVF
jgi:hypothetical protein